MKHYVGLCAIAKDETLYLDEWVRYHIALGVNHILLFDNDSAIPIQETLREWVRAGYVTVVSLPGRGRQLESYQIALDTFGPDCVWLGMLDLDEFIVLKRHLHLQDFLLDYEPYGAVGLNWLAFGTSGHQTRPDTLVTRAYTMRMPDAHPLHFHIKSIVQPAKVLRAGANPHAMWLGPGFYAVNEQKHPIPNGSGFSYFTNALAQVNHYVTKSCEEYHAKKRRGKADAPEGGDGGGNGSTAPAPPFVGSQEDDSILQWLHTQKDYFSQSPEEYRARDVFHRARFQAPAAIALEVAEALKDHNLARAASLVAALTVSAPAELATPVKLKYLRGQRRLESARDIAAHFFTTHYTPETAQEYMAVLRRLGEAGLAHNISAFMTFLQRFHKVDAPKA